MVQVVKENKDLVREVRVLEERNKMLLERLQAEEDRVAERCAFCFQEGPRVQPLEIGARFHPPKSCPWTLGVCVFVMCACDVVCVLCAAIGLSSLCSERHQISVCSWLAST